MKKLMNLIKGEEGVTAIEYGLIASLIAVMIIVGATSLGEKLDACFTYVASLLKSGPA